MKNKNIRTQALVVTPEENVSRSALERSLPRALQFLRAAGTAPEIMQQLAAAGFDLAARRQGWQLVFEVSGLGADGQAGSNPVGEAIAEIDAWIVNGFRRAHAVLHHFHPEVEAFLFQNNLVAAHGPDGVAAVNTFLQRCDALQNSAERKATRKADHAALDAMAARGITADDRNRLKGLVAIVSTQEAVAASNGSPSERTKALSDLYAWITDWSEMARSVVPVRAQLIRLGVAKRRSKKDAAVATPAPSPMIIAPAPPAAVNPPQLPAASSEGSANPQNGVTKAA